MAASRSMSGRVFTENCQYHCDGNCLLPSCDAMQLDCKTHARHLKPVQVMHLGGLVCFHIDVYLLYRCCALFDCSYSEEASNQRIQLVGNKDEMQCRGAENGPGSIVFLFLFPRETVKMCATTLIQQQPHPTTNRS